MSRLDDIAAVTKDKVSDMIAHYRRQFKRAAGDNVFIRSYKTDEAYAASQDYSGFPAKWHRMCCARVNEAVPGVVITYGEVANTAAVPHKPEGHEEISQHLFSEVKNRNDIKAG